MKGARGSAWEFRPESGTLGEGCDLPDPRLSSHFETTPMTLLLRDRCWGADVKAVREQREVKNREDGRETEKRLVVDPKDAGKDRQGPKKQADKESQGQKIKKRQRKEPKQRGWGTENPFPSPAQWPGWVCLPLLLPLGLPPSPAGWGVAQCHTSSSLNHHSPTSVWIFQVTCHGQGLELMPAVCPALLVP